MFNFGFNFGGVGLFFLFIVFLVTSFVCCYRGVYMEHYENTKFTLFLLIFFVSMLIVSLSSRIIVLMVGWDGLGITSICLIIFYPNSNTLFNSILTMFFNRLGDVILILALRLFVFSFGSLSEVTLIRSGFLIFMILCSFSKRAQFPLSRWLPAAISAPTPISAMVHSSTLVTAGLFVLIYFYSVLSFNLLTGVFFFRMCTFLIGGVRANLEKDFKKVVAFSTIRQISMIYCFACLGFLILGCFHMIFHAFFKTLLFCVSGLVFVSRFRDQFKKGLKPFSLELRMKHLFLVRLFGITGLTYSSSFFTKDRVLESVLGVDDPSLSLPFFVGGVLTLVYCSSLFGSIPNHLSSKNSAYFKEFSLGRFIFFSLIILFFPGVFCPSLMERVPLLDFSICLITLFLFLTALSTKFLVPSNFFLSVSFFISGIKFFRYGLFRTVFKNERVSSLIVRRDFFFSPRNFPLGDIGGSSLRRKNLGFIYLLFIFIISLKLLS